jgi:hypothetical protein
MESIIVLFCVRMYLVWVLLLPFCRGFQENRMVVASAALSRFLLFFPFLVCAANSSNPCFALVRSFLFSVPSSFAAQASSSLISSLLRVKWHYTDLDRCQITVGKSTPKRSTHRATINKKRTGFDRTQHIASGCFLRAPPQSQPTSSVGRRSRR